MNKLLNDRLFEIFNLQKSSLGFYEKLVTLAKLLT